MTVKVSKLPNGLTVASDSMPGVETVSLGAWVGVGTRHEPAAINGVAHLLEHMAFKGTERRSAYDIAQEIEAVGGHLNAYTSRENTAFYAKVLVDDAPLAVDILADILLNPTFDEEELRRERAVVLQEIGQANDTPDDIIFDRFQEAAYPEQALGRPVLGTAEIVRGIERPTLQDYMTRHYGAAGMVFAAAGKIEHDGFVALAADAFAALPRAASAAVEPAGYVGGDYRETRDLEQVHVLLGFPTVGYLDPDYYTASVLSTLFGGGMSSRLFQEVREKRGRTGSRAAGRDSSPARGRSRRRSRARYGPARARASRGIRRRGSVPARARPRSCRAAHRRPRRPAQPRARARACRRP